MRVRNITLFFILLTFCINLAGELGIRCRIKKLLDLREKPPKKLVRKAQILIEALGSYKKRKRDTAYTQFRKIALYLIPYIKKIYPKLKKYSQIHYLKDYYFLVDTFTNIRVSDVNIMCSNGNKFIWYGIINDRVLVVGNHNGILNSSLLPMARDIKGVCNLKDGTFTKYAISLGKNLGQGRDFILTDNYFYHNAELVSSPGMDMFGIIKYNSDDKKIVIIDDKESAPYDSVSDIEFSPDSSRYAYTAKKGKEFVLVLDGKEYGKMDIHTACHSFSPDSKKFIYAEEKKGGKKLIIDGIEGKEYDYLGCPIFSPDSSRIVYTVGKDNKYAIVVDGIEFWEDDNTIWFVDFSPDSKRYSYLVMRNDGKKKLVLDGKKIGDYYYSIDIPLYFPYSPDGKKFIYAVRENSITDKQVVFINDKEIGRYDYVNLSKFPNKKLKDINYSSLTLRHVGNKIIIDLKNNRKMILDVLQFSIWSSNGERYAFVAEKDNNTVVVVDGKENIMDSGEVDFSSFVFSPNSKRYAYIVLQKGKMFVMIDDWKSSEYESIGSIKFSPDSKRVVYAATKGNEKSVVVLDGKESKEYESVEDYFFSGDSQRLFAMVFKNKLRRVLVSNEEVEYSDIVSSLVPLKDGAMWLSWKYNKLYVAQCK